MQTTPTIADALAAAGTARLDAELLLAGVLACSRSLLHAYPERRLTPDEHARFHALAERRRRGEPLAYITGTREFWSLTLRVTANVLIPRPETEGVVERVLALAPAGTPRLADLGTGSGAIAVALAHERPQARVTATDRSAAALTVARDNARRLGLEHVRFVQGDWFRALAGERFDVIASNPPYVSDQELDRAQPELAFEPAGALRAGERGLADLYALIRQAPLYLVPGGWLVLEHGAGQEAAVAGAMAEAGFTLVRSHRDLAGLPRITEARRP